MTAIIAAHSIPNMFYILRKDYNEEERKERPESLDFTMFCDGFLGFDSRR